MPQLVEVEGRGVQEFPDDATQEEISAALNKQPAAPKTSALGAAGLGAAASIAPSAAFAATAPFGAKAGLAIGAMVPGAGETGISEAIGAGIGALAVGGTAAALTSMGQEKLLKAVLPESVYNKLQSTRKAAEEEHPIASVGGDIAGAIPSFRLATAPADWAVKKLAQRAAIGAGLGVVQPMITEQRLPTVRDVAASAAFTTAFAEPRFSLTKGPYARSVTTPAKEDGNLPAPPVQGQGALPLQEGGAGVQSPAQAVAKGAQVPLEPKIIPEVDSQGRKTGLYTVTFGLEKQTGLSSPGAARAVAANFRASYTPPATAAERPAEPMAEELSQAEIDRIAEREGITKKEAEDLAYHRQEREGMAMEAAKAEGQELTIAEPTPDQPFTAGGFLRALGGNRIALNRDVFHRWAEEHVTGDVGEAIRTAINEERVHNDVINTIGNAGAESYWNDLTGFERAVTRKTYAGQFRPESGESPAMMGHEAIRYRLQKAMGMEPSEYAQLAGLEKWGIKSINTLSEMVRATRESLGTKASQRQLALLDRIQGNLVVAAAVNSGIAPPESKIREKKPTLDEMAQYVKAAQAHVDYAATRIPQNAQEKADARQNLIDRWTDYMDAYVEQHPESRIRKFTKQGYSRRTEPESKYQPGLLLSRPGVEGEPGRVGATEAGAAPIKPLDKEADRIMSGALSPTLSGETPEGPARFPDFKEFNEWAQRNVETSGLSARLQAWKDAITKHLQDASPARLMGLIKGLGLEKEVGSAPFAEAGAGLSAKKGALVQTGLFPGLGDQPSAESTYRVERRVVGEKTRQERRELAITAIYRELMRRAQPEPDLHPKEITLGDIDFANARAKHGSYRVITPEESTDPEILYTLLSDHARPSKDAPLSHTQRLVALKDRAGESVRLVSVYPEREVLKVVDPAKYGTTDRPNVTMDEKFLARFQPIASVLRNSPVQDFHQRFKSLADWNTRIGKDAARIAGVGDAEALMQAKRDWREAWDEAHADEEGAVDEERDIPVGLRQEDIVAERQQAATQVKRGEGGGLTGEFTEEGRALMGIGRGELGSRAPLTANEVLAVRDLATDPSRFVVTSADEMFEMVGRAIDRIERVSKTKQGSYGLREPKPENLRAADFKALIAINKASQRLFDLADHLKANTLRKLIESKAPEEMLKVAKAEADAEEDQIANDAYSRAVEEFYEIIKTSKDEADLIGKALGRFGRTTAEPPPTKAQLQLRPPPSEALGAQREPTSELAYGRRPAGRLGYTLPQRAELPRFLSPEAQEALRARLEAKDPHKPTVFEERPEQTREEMMRPGVILNTPGASIDPEKSPTFDYDVKTRSPAERARLTRELKERQGPLKPTPESAQAEMFPESQIRKRGEERIDQARRFLGAWGARREVKNETIHTGADIASTGASTMGMSAYRAVHTKSLSEIALEAGRNPKSMWANLKTRLAQEKEAGKVRAAAKAVIATGAIEVKERSVQWVPSQILDWKTRAAEAIDKKIEWLRKNHKKVDELRITKEMEERYKRLAKEYGQPRPVMQTRKFWSPNKGKLADLEAQSREGLKSAQEMAKSPNPWNRRVGNMWAKEAQKRLDEIAYAREHWNDPVMRETVATIRKQLREAWQWEHDHGLKVQQFMNYVPDRFEGEIWNDDSILFSKWEVLGRNFRKARRFENAYQAIQHGPYILKSSDTADLVGHRVRQGAAAVNKGLWYQKITETKDPATNEPIAYWTKQTGKGDPKIILPDGSTADKPMDYEAVSFDGDRAHLAVRKGFVNAVKAAAGESAVRNTPVVRDALRFGQFLKHNGILIYDTFHPARLSQYGLSLTGMPSWQKGWSVLEFPKEMLSGQFPGDKAEVIRKGLLQPETVKWAMEPVEVNLGGGKKLTTTRWDIAQQAVKQSGINVGRLQDTLYNQTSHLLPGLKFMNRFIFDKMTRGLMMQAFVDNFEKYNARNPDIPFQRLMRDVAKDINFRFGAIGRQGLIKQPWLRDVSQLFFLAPQWVEGLAQSEIRTLGRLTGISRMTGRAGLPALGTLGSSMMKGLAAYFAFTQVLNLLNRGKFTFQNPEKDHLLDAYIHIPGTDEKSDFWISPMSVFAELSHDIIRYWETKPKLWDAIDQVGRNKLGPWGRLGMVLARQKNERGEQITSTAGIVKEAAGQLAPYPITFQRPGQLLLSKVGLAAPPQPGVTTRQLMASLGGIKTQAVDTPTRQISRMAERFLSDNNLKAEPVELTPTDQATYGKLRSAIRAGDGRGAERVYQGLLRTHTPEQIFHGMQLAARRPFTGSHAHEQQFISNLSDEQRDLYTAAERERIEGMQAFVNWFTGRP